MQIQEQLRLIIEESQVVAPQPPFDYEEAEQYFEENGIQLCEIYKANQLVVATLGSPKLR